MKGKALLWPFASTAKILGIGIIVLGILVYACSYLWPVYLWGTRLPSPDKSYDLVVLKGDKAAFDDFFYKVYVFPKDVTPHEREEMTRVWYAGVWRGSAYLVYSGYSLPNFHWTGTHSLEIEVDNWWGAPASISEFHPIKQFGPNDSVVTSLVFRKISPGVTSPLSESKTPNQTSSHAE